MTREREKPQDAGLPRTGRREFLGKSLGAAPIVLTVGGGHGGGGRSVHGTLWSSADTKWKHRGGRWWRGGGWDKPKPPHFGDHNRPPEKPHDVQQQPPPASWDFKEPSEDWRSWRSDGDAAAPTDWEWQRGAGEAVPPSHQPPGQLRTKE